MAIDFDSGEKKSVRFSSRPASEAFLGFSKKISGKDRMFFTERLSLLLETGGALLPSLLELKRQSANPVLQSIISGLAEDVQAGRQLSQALERYPEMFSTTYVNLIAASEKGGFMHTILNKLQEMEEKREKLKSILISAFSYPIFLLFFSFGVIIFILVFVFPKFETLFVSIKDQLPFTTVILMGISRAMSEYWFLFISVIPLLGILSTKWILSPSGNKTLAKLKLTTPFLKDIFIPMYLVTILRILGLSLENGVPVLDALKSSRDVIDNFLFRDFIARLENGVEEGRGIASGFEESPLIPSMVSQMIATGEESGNLSIVMTRMADFYENELGKKVELFSKIVEPLMLLLMGVAVGTIVASLILPIFSLSKAVH